MFTVYAEYLPCLKQIYIGFTSDLTDRFLSHNELATKGRTVKYRPWVIAHTEEFQTKKGSYYKGKPIEIGQQQKVCL